MKAHLASQYGHRTTMLPPVWQGRGSGAMAVPGDGGCWSLRQMNSSGARWLSVGRTAVQYWTLDLDLMIL
jgi:hypothetical protein